jgi:hypothetical protein
LPYFRISIRGIPEGSKEIFEKTNLYNFSIKENGVLTRI